MVKKGIFFFLLIHLYFAVGFAQNQPEKYVSNSIDGYIHLYYDQQYYLIDQFCAFKTYTRVVKYDKDQGGFNGFFTDYYNNNSIALTGKYVQGKKEGEFNGFHENGEPKFTISFKDDLPVGNWKYFYPSGNLWISLTFKNNQYKINDFFDEKGKHQVKDGGGKFTLKETALNYNEYGYTGLIYQGRLKDGKPNGVWSTYLVYPKNGNEYIGAEGFNNGNFTLSEYIFPENIPNTKSLIKFYPDLLAENAPLLTFKNCTIDDNQGYNIYLQNYLNKNIIFEKSDVLPQQPFDVNVEIDAKGKFRNITMPDSLSKEFRIALTQIFKVLPYYIPSFINGNTISDTLNITLSLYKDESGRTYFTYPLIKREQGH